MKSKSKTGRIMALACGFLVLFGIFGGIFLLDSMKDKKNSESGEDINTYYSFADVEKPISYLATDDEMVKKLSRLIDPLYKSDNIDALYIKQVFSTIGLDEALYQDLIGDYGDDDWVTTEIFDMIYGRIIDSGVTPGISKTSVFFYEVTYYDETESLLINKDPNAEASGEDTTVDSDNVSEDSYNAANDVDKEELEFINNYNNANRNDSGYGLRDPFSSEEVNDENSGDYLADYIEKENEKTSEEEEKKDNLDIVPNQGRRAVAVYDGMNYYDIDLVKIPDEYVNNIITVYMKNDVIIMLGGKSQDTKTFYNVWIDKYGDGNCSFILDTKMETFPVKEDTVSDERCVADITFDNEGIVDISLKSEDVTGRALSVSDEGIRIEGKGAYNYSTNYRIYNAAGEGVYREDTSNHLVGYKSIRLIVENNEVQAAIIENEIAASNIRVVLNDTNFSSYKHIVAHITSEGAFTVTVNKEEPVTYEAGSEIRLLPRDYNNKDVIKIEPVEPDGMLQVLNIRRSEGNPIYHGSLEVTIKNDYVYIVNDVPLEEYLYSVVSSEVPSSYNLEALKAIAICARGYAYSKMKDGSYSTYSAHVDDSTMCQVYNNVPETEASIYAVKDTYGIVPVYDEKVIYPFYFSTSAGITCSNEDIWGGTSYDYLESNVESVNKERVDLSEEANFRKFIADSYGYDTIEKDLPFYRWSIHFSNAEMSNAINSNLKERIKKSDDGIKVKTDNDKFVVKNIETIGDVESFEVTKRSESGVVLELVIYGSENVIQVSGQTNIRNLISPEKVVIVRNDGSTIKDWTSLPSPYYYVDQVQGGFDIIGGGFGHGVGLSQNGAELLAEQGYNYKFILSHYFSYITYEYIYEDEVKKEDTTEEATEAQ